MFTFFFCVYVPSGKSYIFDIKRTSREAYDYARRKLYSLSQSTQTLNAGNGHGSLQSIYCDGDSVNLDSDRCHAAECQVGYFALY